MPTTKSRPERVKDRAECVCAKCGKTFMAFKWKILAGAKYCGRTCYKADKAPPEARPCEQCKKMFVPTRYGAGRFCTVACAHDHRRANRAPEKTRTCVVCKKEFSRRPNSTTCGAECGATFNRQVMKWHWDDHKRQSEWRAIKKAMKARGEI